MSTPEKSYITVNIEPVPDTGLVHNARQKQVIKIMNQLKPILTEFEVPSRYVEVRPGGFDLIRLRVPRRIEVLLCAEFEELGFDTFNDSDGIADEVRNRNLYSIQQN